MVLKKLILAFVFVSLNLYSQQFSILTCDQGDEVYSTFGHSAIRYQDSSQGIDWVYNYGLFDFSDPKFIPKFCLGKLDYMVGKQDISSFMADYEYNGRRVVDQQINLTKGQSDSLLRFLEWNILDENKFYRYDFLFNNCATRIIDILEQNCAGVNLKFAKNIQRYTFRQLIHQNAMTSVPWIDWGMDLGIGMPTDRVASDRELCFLPSYISQAMNLSTNKANGLKLVGKTQELLPNRSLAANNFWIFKPAFFALICGLLFFVFGRFERKFLKNTVGTICILMGIGGLVLSFLWFCTEHSVTKNNLNLLWMNPLLLILGFQILKNKVKYEFAVFLHVCLIASFFLGPILDFQEFSTASRWLNIGLVFLTTRCVIKGWRVRKSIKTNI